MHSFECYTDLGYVLLKNNQKSYLCSDAVKGSVGCTACKFSADPSISKLIWKNCSVK